MLEMGFTFLFLNVIFVFHLLYLVDIQPALFQLSVHNVTRTEMQHGVQSLVDQLKALGKGCIVCLCQYSKVKCLHRLMNE